ncbi:hypothetical protein LJR168_001183 [Pseudoxanthomonas sp. LjRoot168]|uniref:HzsA-related protein n=1 Tax=unclassified Pseudoxanthomonas TaxID=2645906 RepID=UPI003ECE85C7
MPVFPLSLRQPLLVLFALSVLLTGCGPETPASATKAAARAAAMPSSSPAAQPARVMAAAVPTSAVPNPILFVTQVPMAGDPFASRMSTFANHLPSMLALPRGGDLMIRYPDGTLRNLTKEAGFGMEGQQGANAIAVREPAVHWNGTKAIFSMVVGGPPQRYVHPTAKWQLYEVTGLGQGQTATITKVANQPADYNNVSPIYDSQDRILFTSDRPRGGEAHLYPQLDEYESTPTITGIWQLDPSNGQVRLLNHAPSGAFSPSIDRYGRVIFIRWDHLQRDQQADAGTYGAYDVASEASGAASIGLQPETFPESRSGMSSAYGQVNGFTYNLFTPWQMNQDGTEELTLNHIGRQELSFGYLPKSFSTDSALSDYSNTALIANKKYIRMDGGLFQVREDPTVPGSYYAIYTREFATGGTNQIVRITGAPTLNAEQMEIVDASPAADGSGNLAGGRFRNPLPMSSGHMVASYTSSPSFQSGVSLRLHQLQTNASGMLVAGPALTPGISKNLTWWDPDTQRSYNGALWEIEPVEVVARARPPVTTTPMASPEQAVFASEQVNEAAFRAWLKANQLALIVTRNQTARDRDDKQQPYNLRVPGGVQTLGGNGRIYEVSHYQILQANMIRAYNNGSIYQRGRRPIAQPMAVAANPTNTGGPSGSVRIATDGSTAAFVPASRALTWQSTDAAGVPIVRERVWVTLQAGEIRTCTGCHGENARNQAGAVPSTASPEALRQLLRHWKQQHSTDPIRVNGSQPLIPNRAALPAATSAGAGAVATGDGATLTRRWLEEATPRRDARDATRSHRPAH